MGWWVDEQRRRDEAIREARRQQSEYERDAAFTRGLRFGEALPLTLLPSFATGRTSQAPKPRAIGILDRGVYRNPFSPDGWAEFTIVDSRGVLKRKVGMPEGDVDEHTVPRMNRWLDSVDPLLKVMA